MERMLVVVFDNERNAYEASRALNQLDAEASITVHAESVISKEPNGAVTVKQAEGDFPIRTIAGTAIGSLIGLLGGPLGMVVGATAGAVAGSFGDVYVAGVSMKVTQRDEFAAIIQRNGGQVGALLAQLRQKIAG